MQREQSLARDGHGNASPVVPAAKSLDAATTRVRDDLERIEEDVNELRIGAERELVRRIEAEALLTKERERAADLSRQLRQSEIHREMERTMADRQRERADRLGRLVKQMHRSLFSGHIPDLILKACLNLTGAKRGLYVTTRGSSKQLVVKAAVGVDGYPNKPPSEYITALCRKVLSDNDAFVCNDSDVACHVAATPTEPDENFRNFIVAPAVLLKQLDGIIIAADKESGEFNEEDVDSLVSIGDHASVAMDNARLNRELQAAYLSTVSVLADAVQAKDPYTQGHCEMVSRLARLTADKLDLTGPERDVVCYSALLHDVGKIGVSDGVLNKPGPLLPEERELVRSHVRVGHDLLNNVAALRSVADIVLHHHEWYDGTGYPDKQKGEEIPIAARIVAVVDAYCAMTTRRSYKDAYDTADAADELRRCAGSQFDPKVVDAFLAIYDTPEAKDWDDDDDAECGLLPGFRALTREKASAQ
jgi:putative nucleotidyltransferase with HDIG domain